MNNLHIGMNSDRSPSILHLKMANRHGLIAGATGTGKTVTLQSIAEQFSEAGVPVFATDVKGDLSGIAHPGVFKEGLIKRAELLGIEDYTPKGYPTRTWDLFGEKGEAMRATVQDMGPLLMARLLNLTQTQAGVLNVIFLMCERESLPLLDLQDFREALIFAFDNAERVSRDYGYVSPSTLGIVQRGIASLDAQGGNKFFGIPSFDVHELMATDAGLGRINLLAADSLMESPQIYAAFIMWLMQTLFRTLPEVGDLDKPKMVFFFDEAHLLFKDAPKALVDTIERVVRLIRSKGVGIYFVTQSPTDIPDAILAQLGNRYQHALRAFTARDQRAVRAAAETFRPNPHFDTKVEIGKLGIGVALCSVLDTKSQPTVVDIVFIRPPRSHIGPVHKQASVGATQPPPAKAPVVLRSVPRPPKDHSDNPIFQLAAQALGMIIAASAVYFLLTTLFG